MDRSSDPYDWEYHLYQRYFHAISVLNQFATISDTPSPEHWPAFPSYTEVVSQIRTKLLDFRSGLYAQKEFKTDTPQMPYGGPPLSSGIAISLINNVVEPPTLSQERHDIHLKLKANLHRAVSVGKQIVDLPLGQLPLPSWHQQKPLDMWFEVVGNEATEAFSTMEQEKRLSAVSMSLTTPYPTNWVTPVKIMGRTNKAFHCSTGSSLSLRYGNYMQRPVTSRLGGPQSRTNIASGTNATGQLSVIDTCDTVRRRGRRNGT